MKVDFNRFKSITGYDIELFLSDFKSFVTNNYSDIVNYYNGGLLAQNSFYELERLKTEANKIEPLFELHKGALTTVDFWELLDVFSDIQIRLETISKTGKWERSSRLGTQNSAVKTESILKQKETFEDVISDLGSSNSQNEWKDLTLSNFIEEEMYTPQGGTMFTLPLVYGGNIDLPNIVDYFTKNNIYGKDIAQKVEFVGNDLATVTGQDALLQGFTIKIGMFKGDNPEFPNDGLPIDLIGGNFASIQYPTIIRDLLDLFKKDARWREVDIIDLYREGDSIFLKISCKSLSGDEFINNLLVQ